MSSRFIPIAPGTDPSQQIAQINKNFGELDNENTTKVFYNASGNIGVTQGLLPNNLGEGFVLNDNNGIPLIVMYVDADNKPVLKVASTGQDATTATADQLLFDSAHGVRYLTNFSAPFTVTSGVNFTATTVTITHNLGYVPLTDNVANIATNGWAPGETGIFPLPYQSMATSGTIRGYAAYVILKQVTSTTITYEVGVTGGTLTLAGTITCYVKQST